MNYIFKNRFDIRELTGRAESPRRIIIAEPELYACALYAYHLSSADYFVKSCGSWEILDRQLRTFDPHLLVLNPSVGGAFLSQSGLLKRIREVNPGLLVVSVGSLSTVGELKRLMAAGVSAHLDRQLTRPQDVVAVVRSLLSYV